MDILIEVEMMKGFFNACKSHQNYSDFIKWDDTDEMAPGHFSYNCVIDDESAEIQIRITDFVEQGERIGGIFVKRKTAWIPDKLIPDLGPPVTDRFYNERGKFSAEITIKDSSDFKEALVLSNKYPDKTPEEVMDEFRKQHNRFIHSLTKAELCNNHFKQVGLDCKKNEKLLSYFFSAHETFKEDIE